MRRRVGLILYSLVLGQRRLIVISLIFLIAVAELNVPSYAGMIYTNTEETDWLGTPTIAIHAPPDGSVAEGTNPEGRGDRYTIGQCFKVDSGMPLTLDKIAIYGSGGLQTFTNLRIQDLGTGAPPTSYSEGTDLLPYGAWTFYGSASTTVKEFDFTDEDEIALYHGHTYVFEFVDDVSEGGMWWFRGGDVYADGESYVALDSPSADRVLLHTGSRDLSMAVYLVIAGGSVPTNTPFLNVDINGENGPTQTTYPSGWPDPWSSWDFDRTPATNTFSKSFGNVDVTLTAVNYEGTLPQSRDRGNQSDDQYLGYEHRDFLYTPHSSSIGLGWDYFEIEFSGLNVETQYEFTFWSYDDSHSGDIDGKFMCWGIENPGDYGYYQPGMDPCAPYLARAPMAGNWPSNPNVDDPYYYSGGLNATTDVNGVATIYGWADFNSFSGSTHAPFSGFAVGVADFVWEGDTSDDCITATNWQGYTAPSGSLGSALAFGNLDTGNRTVANFDGTYTDVSGIRFNGASAGYSISGSGSISLDSGAAVGGNSGYAHTINVDLVSNDSNGILFNNTDNLTIGGVISTGVAGGGITLSGASTLTLNGTNTYTGGTTMSAGTIVLGNDSALGTGTLTVSGGNGTIQSDNDARLVSNAVSIDNTRTLTVSGASNLALSGAISGAGSLATSMTAAADTLSLSGNNTYSGGTTLNTGTIILGHDAALGSGGLTLGGNGTIQSDNDSRSVSNTIDTAGNALTVSGASNLALTGVISGGGSLAKQDSGTLTLSGNNTYTGITTLSAGTLNLSGQLYGNVVVDGGTFMGTGTIANSGNLTLNNGGVLAPGSSIGTTIITGDYVQNAGSTLEVEVFKAADETLSSDLLDVTGTATLEASSTINITDLTVSDQIILTGDIFTIITTGGGVTDNGAAVTSASVSLSFDGSISGNDYILTTTRKPFCSSGIGSNNIAVLQAIDSDIDSASGDYATIINELSSLGVAALNAAAERLSPLSHTSIEVSNATLAHDLSLDLTGYLGARRHNTEYLAKFETLRHSDLLLADASGNPQTLAYVIRETERRKQRQEEADREVHAFFRPFGVFLDQGSTPKFAGFQARATGAQFGKDQVSESNWILGLSGSYSHSFLDFDKGLGSGDIDSFRVGPYASYFVERFYVNSSVSLSCHLNRTRREVEFGGIDRTAKANYDAYDLSAYATAGYEFDFGQWTLTPTASVQYTCYRNESFKESGAGDAGLSVDARTQQSLLSRFGIRLYNVAELDTLKIAPELFVGYAHEFFDEKDIEASFVGGTAKFSTDIDSNRDDSFYFGAGLSFLLKEHISAYVRYEGEYSSGNEANSLSVGVTVLF